jgi:hypothetical protein
MTREKALAFLQRVQREAPGIQATFDDSYARDGNGYRVHLRLACREISVNYADQWESIKQAWQWFLPGLQQEEPARTYATTNGRPRQRPRCLVDGIVMAVYQKKGTPYWMGTWWQEGKQHYRAFGKVDPRTLYPIVESQEREDIAV